jgi:Uncharacterised protein family UPF0102
MYGSVMDDRPALGANGEDAVAALYRSRGFTVLARNWRCRIGELDVVAGRGDLLVVCEVKTRRGARFGDGYEAVTARVSTSPACTPRARGSTSSSSKTRSDPGPALAQPSAAARAKSSTTPSASAAVER